MTVGRPAGGTSPRADVDAASAGGAGAPAAASLVMASLGLAALAGGGGSLLLAQLALMLATVTAVPGLWAWLRPKSGVTVTPTALMPLGLAWLAIATTLLLTGVGAGRLALLALAFVAPLATSRIGWLARRPRWAPVAVVAIAGVPVALAVAWQLAAGGESANSPASPLSPGGDDPYYQPQWK